MGERYTAKGPPFKPFLWQVDKPSQNHERRRMQDDSLKPHWWFITLMGTIYMFNFIDRTIISVLGESIRRDLDLSDFQLGMMGGLSFALFYTVMGIPLARIAEKRNRIGLIAAVTAAWSLMTALSGAVGGFAQMLACRAGVGVGEAGFTPALVSLLSDKFAPNKRATAWSIVTLGVPIGGAVAAVVGGWLAQNFGWRLAFVMVGAPGLFLAALTFFTLKEPERAAKGEAASFGTVLTHLGKSRAFVTLTLGSALVAMVGYAMSLFLVPLLMRRYGFEVKAAGGIFAATYSLATAIGMLGGGMIADRLGERSVTWFGKAPAIAVTAALPLIIAGMLQDDWRMLMVLLFLASLCLYAFLPAIMTVTQRLVPPEMRASAAAFHAFGQTVIGLGLGSLVVGKLSDMLTARAFGADFAAVCTAKKLLGPCATASATGLQQAMIAVSFVLVFAALLYVAAARALRVETGESGNGAILLQT
jgi:predicted MFS family arabinose efflux permease